MTVTMVATATLPTTTPEFSYPVPSPAGSQAEDMLVVICLGLGPTVITPPDGTWTTTTSYASSSGSSVGRVSAFYKPLTAAAAATYSFDASDDTHGLAGFASFLLRRSGEFGHWVMSVNGVNDDSLTPFNAPSIAAAGPAVCMAAIAGFGNSGNAHISPGSPFVEVFNNPAPGTGKPYGAAGYQTYAAAGTDGPWSFTGSSSVQGLISIAASHGLPVSGLTATVEPENVPPRIKLDLVWTGETEASIYRLDPDGVERPVREAEPTPVSGGLAVIYDYESPFGAPVTYRAVSGLDEIVADAVTLDIEVPWLRHPGKPSLSVSVWPYEPADVVYGVAQAVFRPIGRKFPVVITGGQRYAKETTMTFRTWELEDERKFLELIADGHILLLDVPLAYGWGITHQYMACGTITKKRLVEDQGQVPYREWDVPYNEVERPAGGLQAQWTFGSVTAEFATFAEVAATYTNFADMLANVRD